MEIVIKRAVLGCLLFCVVLNYTHLSADKPDHILVLKNGTIINGHGGRPVEEGAIVIKGDKIVWVGNTDDLIIPAGAEVIDVHGKTVMPGLADMHVHFMGGWDGNRTELLGFQRYLNAYLYAGVTTILDMGNITPYILQLRQEVNAGRIPGPRIYCVGPLIDGPDAQWPSFSASITSSAQIPMLVEKLKSKNIDLLKAYKGLSFNNIRSLVYHAKKNKLKVIVDQGSMNGSYSLAGLEIEAFAHLPGKNEITNQTMGLMRSKNIKCMTTLTVLENYSHQRLSELDFINDPLIKDTTPPRFLEQLTQYANRKLDEDDQRKIKYFTKILARAKKNLKKMSDAGIVLIAGTDAPYPGVFQGESIHRELELIVDSGLTPLQAITMATKNGSILLKKESEWGTLDAGKMANILIINGRPDLNISDTRKIDQVILKGKLLNRNKLKFDILKDRGFRAADKVETD